MLSSFTKLEEGKGGMSAESDILRGETRQASLSSSKIYSAISNFPDQPLSAAGTTGWYKLIRRKRENIEREY